MAGDDEDISARKTHRKRQAGPKAEKKKAKNQHEQELSAKQRNPKAFSYHSVNKVARAVRRTLDIKAKKHHIPVVDRTPVEPPPVLIAVVGPPKVGKTTLIKCLIKNFTRQKMSNIQGPVTIVSGKKRRLTLIECNNDINCMIDVAKVADLVLLLVDASFGFEMEIFEFLNICQVHGFPKIMGVLTHLDHFRNNKQLSKTKKKLKHRFWTEVYQGAKLFYLSGMVNGEYQKTEIHNLGRFISVMKFRPLLWRTTHPYLMADRMEDVTDPEVLRQNKKADRSVCLYGYVRGTHLKNQSSIHIAGCGDFMINNMSYLPDPCPLPNSEKKRSLNEKERLVYAPMSGVGGIVYDKDAIYIDLGGSHSYNKPQDQNEKPSNQLVSQLIDTKKTIDEKMAESDVALFSNSARITTFPEEEIVTDSDGRVRRKAVFNDDDMDDDKSDNESDEEDDDEEEASDEDAEESEIIKTSRTSIKSQDKMRKVDEESFAFDDSDDDDVDALLTSRKTVTAKTDANVDTCIDEDESGDSDEDDRKQSKTKETSGPKPLGRNKDEGIAQKVKSVLDKLSSKDKQGKNTVGVKNKQKIEFDGNDSKEVMDEDLDSESGNDEDSAEDDDLEDEDSEAGEGSDEDAETSDAEMKQEDDDEEEHSGDDDEEETGNLKWKENLMEKAAAAFRKRQEETPNLQKLVYGNVWEKNDDENESEEEDEVGGLFKVNRKATSDKTTSQRSTLNGLDCSKTPSNFTLSVVDWDVEQIRDAIMDCFVTGKWDAAEDAEALLKEDDELFGDFEDLETGEKFSGKKDEDVSGSEDEAAEAEEKQDDGPGGKSRLQYKEQLEKKREQKRIDKKKRLKELFDSQYDGKGGEEETYFDQLKSEMEQQAQLNRQEFEDLDEETRAQYEGFRPGVYVRVQINNMPCEFVDNFDPTYPVILGALLASEHNIGYVQFRLKKHRWYKRILKTRDPLIISLGWRRFQSIAMYYIQDHNGRNRLLKYTPEHLHCNASIWGPITPQGTGMLAVQTVAGASPEFRISATGVVLELDKSISIVKKLKLVGTPFKIYKKTAFIQGMFNSSLEVAKFEGSKIRTVSGLRGQIKKSVQKPEGAFRATFEDKILLSDIAFVRTWYQVEVPKFYNPVTNLLLTTEEKNQWQGMKTAGQLRREKGVKRQINEDNLYKPVERQPRGFNQLVIPRELQRNLPFKDKPKVAKNTRDPVQSQRIAVIREPRERKIAQMMKMLKTLHEHKMKTRRIQMRERAAKHEKEMGRVDAKRDVKRKELKKQIYRSIGKAEKRKERREKD